MQNTFFLMCYVQYIFPCRSMSPVPVAKPIVSDPPIQTGITPRLTEATRKPSLWSPTVAHGAKATKSIGTWGAGAHAEAKPVEWRTRPRRRSATVKRPRGHTEAKFMDGQTKPVLPEELSRSVKLTMFS